MVPTSFVTTEVFLPLDVLFGDTMDIRRCNFQCYGDGSHLPQDRFVLVGRSLSSGVPPFDPHRYHVIPGFHGEEYQ